MSLRTTFHVAYPPDPDGNSREDLVFHRPCRNVSEARALANRYNEDPTLLGVIYQIISPRGVTYPVFQLRAVA